MLEKLINTAKERAHYEGDFSDELNIAKYSLLEWYILQSGCVKWIKNKFNTKMDEWLNSIRNKLNERRPCKQDKNK